MPEPNNPELALRGTDSFTYAFYRHDPQRADHFDVHYHGEYEIIYVSKGSFHYLAGGADYWLRPGETLFLDQYSIHAFLEPAQPCGSYQGILFGKKFLFPSDTNPACRQFYEEIPPQRFSLTQKLTGATPWQQEILALIRRLLHLGRTPEENALPIQISLLTILTSCGRSRLTPPSRTTWRPRTKPSGKRCSTSAGTLTKSSPSAASPTPSISA